MITYELAERIVDPEIGVGRLFAVWNASPELASPLVVLLPACWPEGRWVFMDPLPGVVLLLASDITDFFVLFFSAFVSSSRRANESSNIVRALIKTNTSCLSMIF